jgi:hypothetical protein
MVMNEISYLLRPDCGEPLAARLRGQVPVYYGHIIRGAETSRFDQNQKKPVRLHAVKGREPSAGNQGRD